MSRKPHKSKEIEAVLRELESLGWTVTLRSGRGHAWGLIRCPNNDPDCRCGEFCQMGVWSTPQNPGLVCPATEEPGAWLHEARQCR